MGDVAAESFVAPFSKLAGQFAEDWNEETIGNVISEEDWSTVMAVVNVHCMAPYAEKYGTTITGKVGGILIKKTLKKALLGPFALPFTVVDLAVTSTNKGEALKASFEAVTEYIDKVNAYAAENEKAVKLFLVQTEVETKPGTTKKMKALKVKWGDGFDAADEGDAPLVLDNDEDDDDFDEDDVPREEL